MRLTCILVSGLLAALPGCGRLGYGPSDSAIRISSDGFAVEDAHYDVTTTEEGFAMAWSEFAPGSGARQLTVALTDHRGRVRGGPKVIVEAGLEPALDTIEIHTRADMGLDVLFTKGTEICVARLDSRGDVIMLYEWTNDVGISRADFVPMPDGYGLFFDTSIGSNNAVHYRRLGPTGEPLGASVHLEAITDGQSRPRAVFDGTRFIVVWLSNSRVQFAFVAPDGTLEAPSARVLEEGGSQEVPEITWAGDHALVAFHHDASIRLLGISADGTPWATPTDTMPGPRRESPDFELAVRGETVLVASEYDRLTLHAQVAITAVDSLAPTPAPPPPTEISDPAWSYVKPRVAPGRDGFAVLYRGDVEGSRRLLLQMVEE